MMASLNTLVQFSVANNYCSVCSYSQILCCPGLELGVVDYSHILAIWVCATGKGMVFKSSTLG